MVLTIAQYAAAISAIAATIALLIKLIIGMRKIRDGQKCVLRSDMLRIYYSCQEKKEIRQYQFENFSLMYAAYKKLGGNSFIDKIWAEIQTWRIVS